MQKNQKFYPGQIGTVAVILTSILLVIGVSVAARITKDANQATQRTESTQALNTAEGNLETQPEDAITQITGDDSMDISAGDSVEIKEPIGEPVVISFADRASESPKCTADQYAALLVSVYCTNASNITSVDYYPFRAVNDNNQTGFTASTAVTGDGIYTNKISAENGLGDCPDGSISKTVRIKVLFCNTKIKSAGLVTTTRSLSQDNSGQQARVIEQKETTPAAPSIMDYALFAGTGNLEVTQ